MDILAIIIHGIEYNPISYPADLFIIFFCSQNSLKCVIMEQWTRLQNKLKIYVEQDIFMHVLAGALQMKRIGNRLDIWIEYVCFSLNCIALAGTIYISYITEWILRRWRTLRRTFYIFRSISSNLEITFV